MKIDLPGMLTLAESGPYPDGVACNKVMPGDGTQEMETGSKSYSSSNSFGFQQRSICMMSLIRYFPRLPRTVLKRPLPG